MTFKEYIEKEQPKLTFFAKSLSSMAIKAIEDYAQFMVISNGTGKLPTSNDFLMQPAILNTDEKKYQCKCIDCGKTFMSYIENINICPDCLPF